MIDSFTRAVLLFLDHSSPGKKLRRNIAIISGGQVNNRSPADIFRTTEGKSERMRLRTNDTFVLHPSGESVGDARKVRRANNSPSPSVRRANNSPSPAVRCANNSPSSAVRCANNSPSSAVRRANNSPSSAVRRAYNSPSPAVRRANNSPSPAVRCANSSPSSAVRCANNSPSSAVRCANNSPSSAVRRVYNSPSPAVRRPTARLALQSDVPTTCLALQSDVPTACLALQSDVPTARLALNQTCLQLALALQSDVPTARLALQSDVPTARLALQSPCNHPRDYSRVENLIKKTTLSTLDRDSTPDLPIIVSLVYCERDALDQWYSTWGVRRPHRGEEEFDFDKLFTADNFTPSEQGRCDDDDDSACDMSKSHDKKRPHRGDEHQYNLRNRKMHDNRQISPFKFDPFKPNDEFHSPHYKNDLRKDSMAPQYCNMSNCKELGGNITPTSNRCIMGKKSNNDPTKDVSPPCLWRKHFHQVSNSEGGENSSKPQQTPEPRQSIPWLESGTTSDRNSGIVAEILKKEERMVMETTPLYGCKGCGPNHIQNPNLDNKGEPKCKFDQPKEEDKMNVFTPKETSNTRYTPREHNSVNITPLIGSLRPNLLGDGNNYLNVTPPYRWGTLQKPETSE
uniref:(California timema) hypothetical protein n=1 Tax=Timema californicum TaxID=61474 RepID=A0A7R9P5G5_TIMCA|nr:unnamed protein product [Timema californicum]